MNERFLQRGLLMPRWEPKPFVFSMIKPMGMEPSVLGEIDEKLTSLGNIAVRLPMVATRELMESHYNHLHSKVGESGRHFLEPIVQYYEGKQVLPFVLESSDPFMSHDEFVRSVRQLAGKSRPTRTQPGQIRHIPLERGIPFIFPQAGVDPEFDEPYAFDNLIHVSDCPQAAIDEIGLWFGAYPEVVDRYEQYFIYVNPES